MPHIPTVAQLEHADAIVRRFTGLAASNWGAPVPAPPLAVAIENAAMVDAVAKVTGVAVRVDTVLESVRAMVRARVADRTVLLEAGALVESLSPGTWVLDVSPRLRAAALHTWRIGQLAIACAVNGGGALRADATLHVFVRAKHALACAPRDTVN